MMAFETEDVHSILGLLAVVVVGLSFGTLDNVLLAKGNFTRTLRTALKRKGRSATSDVRVAHRFGGPLTGLLDVAPTR